MLEIARITLYEYWRNKTFLLFYLISLLCIRWGGFVVSQLVIQDSVAVLTNFLYNMLEIILLIVMMFLVSYSLHHDIQRKTFILLHTKNVSATSYVFGKFLGFISMIVIFCLIFFLTYCIYAYIQAIDVTIFWYMALSALLIVCKMFVMIAIVLLASSLFSPLFSFCISLGIYVIAHLYGFILFSLQQDSHTGLLYYIFLIVFYFFPHFDILTSYTPVWTLTIPYQNMFMWIVLHIVYTVVILILCIYSVSNKKKFSLHGFR